MVKKHLNIRKSGKSHYQEIREILEAEIATGIYPIGTLFSTDKVLSERFGLGRHTIREALRGLQESGLLVRRAGLGTVVIALVPPSRYSYRVDTLTKLDQYAADTHFDKSEEGVVILLETMASSLGREVGEKWLRFAGIRKLIDDSQPLCWTEIFVASPYFGIRDQQVKNKGPLFGRIANQFKIEVSSVKQQVRAIIIPDKIAGLLGAEKKSPAMLVRRTYYADGPDPFEISLSIHPADRYALNTSFTREISN